MQIELKPIAEYRKEYKVYALFEGSDRRFADIVRNEHAEDPTDAVCIAAWGMDSSLMNYKKMAYECIGGDHIIGALEDIDKYAYRYIKPRGKEAQETVISRIAEEYLAYKA